MSEHKCACSDKKKFNWSSAFYFFIIISVAVIMIFGTTDDCDKKAEEQTKRINKLEKNNMYMVEYQASLNKVIANMTAILSNQTQAITMLKKMVDIQVMSYNSPTDFDFDLPATESSTSNGIDLLDVSLYDDSLIEVMKEHPFQFIFGNMTK